MSRPHPAVLMFIAHRHAEERILARLAEEGFDDLTLAQARLAARVGEEGTRVTDLATQAQVTKQTAGALVDQLERAGYVTREPDPRDARARLVTLADRGRQAQAAARQVEAALAQEWEEHLGAEQMRQLRDALASLREITDPWAPR